MCLCTRGVSGDAYDPKRDIEMLAAETLEDDFMDDAQREESLCPSDIEVLTEYRKSSGSTVRVDSDDEEERKSPSDNVCSVNAVAAIMKPKAKKWQFLTSSRRRRTRYGPDHRPGDQLCVCRHCRPHTFKPCDLSAFSGRSRSKQDDRDRLTHFQ